MKRYEDLKGDTADIEQIQKTIERIFNSTIKLKSDVGKSIEISETDYSIINSDVFFAKNYVADYGYDINIFYDKSMNRKFYIKFTVM